MLLVKRKKKSCAFFIVIYLCYLKFDFNELTTLGYFFLENYNQPFNFCEEKSTFFSEKTIKDFMRFFTTFILVNI